MARSLYRLNHSAVEDMSAGVCPIPTRKAAIGPGYLRGWQTAQSRRGIGPRPTHEGVPRPLEFGLHVKVRLTGRCPNTSGASAIPRHGQHDHSAGCAEHWRFEYWMNVSLS